MYVLSWSVGHFPKCKIHESADARIRPSISDLPEAMQLYYQAATIATS